MSFISDLILHATDKFAGDVIVCTAVPATDIYGTDKKTYINIGSGTVLRLHWETPTLSNSETVDYYRLILKRHDSTLEVDVYFDIFDSNIGLVNEFYVDSSILPPTLQYELYAQIIAHGKQGSIITSDPINTYISRGTGTYVKVQPAGYKEPIMKRAVAFAKASAPEVITEPVLLDSTEEKLYAKNKEGKVVVLKATEAKKILASSSWNVMLKGYVKDSYGTWKDNDIKYEVLVDKTGEIIKDNTNELVYVL